MKFNIRKWAWGAALVAVLALCLSATGAQPTFYSSLSGRIFSVLSPNLCVGDNTHAGGVYLSDGNSGYTSMTGAGQQGRNVLDNGGFAIQQRMAVASTAIAGVSTTTRAGQVSDRWAVTTSVASNLNWQQVDTSGTPQTGLAARYYGSIIASTAGKKVMLSQWILNSDMAHLRGRTVRLSLKTNQKVGAAQTFHLGLLQLATAGTVDTSPAFLTGAWSTTTGTAPAWGTNLAAIAPTAGQQTEGGTVNGSYFDITTTATTWVRSSCVFTVPSDALNLIPVFFSDATSGTTDNISVAEFQLTQGTDIIPYSAVPLAAELERCQRFFTKSFPYAIVPAASVSLANGGYGSVGILGKSGSGTALACHIGIIFPERMWKVPTLTLYTPVTTGATIYRYDGTTPAAQGTATAATSSTTDIGSLVTATNEATTNGAVGDGICIHWSADADFSA